MAAARISVADFESSQVPPVCVFTGVPAENVFRFRFDGVEGGLPVHGEAIAAFAKLRKAIIAMAVASAVAFGVGTFAASGVASVVGIGLLVIAIVMTFGARKRLVRGRVIDEQVHLSNVHFAFAKAIDCPPGTCKECPSLAECKNQNEHA